MARPKDEKGFPMDYAHKRLPEAAALVQAAVWAIKDDGRFSHLTISRKMALAQKAIDHVVDGGAVPKALFKRDKDHPENRAMGELWSIMVRTIVKERAALPARKS
jgi:hypothetical protein